MYYTGKRGCSYEQLYFLGVTVMHIFYATIASRDIFDTGIIVILLHTFKYISGICKQFFLFCYGGWTDSNFFNTIYKEQIVCMITI